MKTSIITLILSILFFQESFCTIRTVSNHSAGGAQYASLRAAYDAAVDNDTLLVEGTDIAYHLNNQCNFHWNKKLIVIGIGYNPNKQVAKRTKFQNTHCGSGDDWHFGFGASGSVFYGIEFLNHTRCYETVNNIRFENCKFNVAFFFQDNAPSNSCSFINCVFDGNNVYNFRFPSGAQPVNCLISNCIFDGYIEGFLNPLLTVSIEHCLFLSTTATLSQMKYAQIENCIFLNSFPNSSQSNCNFENNLCGVAGTFPPAPANGNTASGNIENTSPMFVNCPPGSFYSATLDFHLQGGSPAIGTANNGTDMGVHGGYSGFSEQGETLINPIIRAMNILNTSVASNGTLNVQLHATKPDNN